MYVIERTEAEVLIRRGGKVVYKASQDSWVVWRAEEGAGHLRADQVKNLKDSELMLALANAVEIKES